MPYSFPVFQDMEQSRLGFHAWIQGNYFNKPAIRKSSVFLCTNPVYYCNFFIGLNKTILGYFGLPLLYMVPQESWSRHCIPNRVQKKTGAVKGDCLGVGRPLASICLRICYVYFALLVIKGNLSLLDIFFSFFSTGRRSTWKICGFKHRLFGP